MRDAAIRSDKHADGDPELRNLIVDAAVLLDGIASQHIEGPIRFRLAERASRAGVPMSVSYEDTSWMLGLVV